MICNCTHANVEHAEEGACFLCDCPAFLPMTKAEVQGFGVALPANARQKPASAGAPAPARLADVEAALFADDEGDAEGFGI